MAYKNTETNTSAKASYGQWAYFTSAVGKLNPQREATINAPVHNVVTEKEEDWLGVIRGVTDLGRGAYEIFQQASYDEADEFFKNHSLEEYSKLMKEESIPFQWNPVAMARLKYNTGKQAYNLATLEFKERVARGEFIGKSPEEVDNAYYQAVNKTRDDMQDTFEFANAHDLYFNKGLFENAPEGRTAVLADQVGKESAFRAEQATINGISRVASLLNDPTKSIQDIYNEVSSFDQIDGIYLSPQGKLAFHQNVLEMMSLRAGYGSKIQEYSKMKVPGTDMTFEEYLGESKVAEYAVNSENLKIKVDGEAQAKFRETISNLKYEGKVGTLKLMLKEYLKGNGNTWDSRAESMADAIDVANHQNTIRIQKSIADTEAQREHTKKSARVAAYANASRTAIADVATVNDMSDKEFNQYLDDMKISPFDSFLLARNPSFRGAKHMTQRLRNEFTQIKNGILTAADSGVVPEEPPESLAEFAKMYESSPYDWGRVFGEQSSDDFMTVLLSNLSSGTPYREAVIGVHQWKELEKKKGVKDKLNDSLEATFEVSNFMKLDGDIINEAKSLFGNFHKINPNISTQEALNKTMQIMEQRYTPVAESLPIPNGWLMGNADDPKMFNDPNVLMDGLDGVPNTSFRELFERKRKEHLVTSRHSNRGIAVDPDWLRCEETVDENGNELLAFYDYGRGNGQTAVFTITRAEVGEIKKNYIDAYNNRWKREDDAWNKYKPSGSELDHPFIKNVRRYQ